MTMALLGGACGDGTATVTSRTPATTVTTATTLPPSTTTTSPPVTSPTALARGSVETVTPTLQRRDVAPEGVAAQFSFGLARTDCRLELNLSRPDRLPVAPPEVQEEDVLSICVFGADRQPVTLAVFDPDGYAFPVTGRDRDWYVSIRLRDPLGTYSITASDGTLTLATTFSVVETSRVRIEALGPWSAPAGSPFGFLILSPTPSRIVTVDLYHQDSGDGSYRYLTTLEELYTDDRGWATFEVETGPGDRGRYAMVLRPDVPPPSRASADIRFEVT